jgi:hypothetical protein
MKHALTAAALVLTAPAFAGPLNKNVVAADAQWVIHVDTEAFFNSTCGRFVANCPDPEMRRGLDDFKAQSGIDPFTDIKGVTIYGSSGNPEEGVLIVETTDAVDGIADRLKDKEKSFKVVTESGATIYTWTEHGETRMALIHAGKGPHDRLVVAAADKDRLLAAAALVDGTGRNLSGASGSLLARTPKPGSILFAAGTNLSKLSQAESLCLNRAEALALDAGESDNQLFADLVVVPKDPADANNIMKLMQGAVAFSAMATQGDAEWRDVASVLQGITFDLEDNRITAHLRCSSDLLLRAMNQAEKAHKSENSQHKTKPAAKNHDDDRGPDR